MRVITRSRVVGLLGGHLPGTVWTLENGEPWQQVDEVFEWPYEADPAASVLEGDDGAIYLNIEGLNVLVRVVPAGGPPAE
jgi:hypothetical protein